MYDSTVHQGCQGLQADTNSRVRPITQGETSANILLVVANPDTSSFTASVAEKVREGLMTAGAEAVEIADLAREGFDPRMGEEDLACYRGSAAPPSDIRREQERIDRTDALVCQSASKFDPRSASNSDPADIDPVPPFCGLIRSGS